MPNDWRWLPDWAGLIRLTSLFLIQGVEPTLCTLLKWAGAVFDDLCQGVREIEFLADPTGGER